MRGYAREIAFCQLYQNLFNCSIEVDFVFFDQEKLTTDDKVFINKIIDYAVQNREKIDQTVEGLSHSFKIDRIYRTDLALLQLAIAEMSAVDTPVAVVINETLSIAKKYSTNKSVKFLNGILASFVKDSEK